MKKFVAIPIITVVMGFFIYWNFAKPCQFLDVFFNLSQCAEQHADLRANFAAVTSPDGSLLAMGTLDGKVIVWQVDDMTLTPIDTLIVTFVSEESFTSTRTIFGVISPTQIKTIAFSPDNQYLAAASENGRISLFKQLEGRYQLLDSLDMMSDFLDFSFDNSTLAIASNGEVTLWNANDLSLNHTLEGDSFALSPTDKLLAVHHPERGITVWDFTNDTLTEQGIISVDKIGDGKFGLTFSPKNNELLLMGFSSRSKYKLSLWNTSNLELITNFNEESASSWPGSIVFSEDGAELMIGTSLRYGPYVRKWQTDTGEKVMQFEVDKQHGLVRTSNVVPSVNHENLFVLSAQSDVLQVWLLPENETS